MKLTAAISEFVANARIENFSPDETLIARHSILDWFGVSLAALDEPLVAILTEFDEFNGGPAQASVIGLARRRPAMAAANINGAISHALDYDDVSLFMRGHPTVPVFSAVLALAESRGIHGSRLLQSFVVGAETCIRIARWLGNPHIFRGWHNTGTAGSIGAAAGCANLLGLSPQATATAIGIAASRLSGLKANFGTMCKPLHAGNAAATGVFAAKLAEKGFTASQEILDESANFTQALGSTGDESLLIGDLGKDMLHNMVYKLHAACYGTHAAIEAGIAARRSEGFNLDAVKSVRVDVDPCHKPLCSIERPKTGLEAKFSISFTTAMALVGIDTSNPATYTDELVRDARLTELEQRIEVRFLPEVGRLKSTVTVDMDQAPTIQTHGDVSVRIEDLDEQDRKVTTKFRSLAEPILGPERRARLEELVKNLTELADVSELGTICAIR